MSRAASLFVLLALSLGAAACSAQVDLTTNEVTSAGGGFSTPGPGDPTPGPTDTPGPEETLTPEPDDPPVATTPEAGDPTPAPSDDVEDDLPYDQTILLSFADVEAYWAIRLPEAFDTEFEPVTEKIPYRPSQPSTLPSCGGETGPPEVYQFNAFYCPPDDFIAYDDEGLFPDLYGTFGDFAVALVIAHEYGHAIQNRIGQDFGPTIYIELQADCLAGAWTGTVERGESPTDLTLSPTDLEEAIGGYLTFADPIGTPSQAQGAHGSGFDRMRAFLDGFTNDVEACGDYLTNRPPVAELPVFQDDPAGNMPLVELEPLLEQDLNDWWAGEGSDLLGIAWTAPTVRTYQSPGQAPDCDGAAVRSDLALERGYYCVEDNLIAYDAGPFQQDLFATAGDLTATYQLLHLYGQSVAIAQGLTDPAEVVARADCLAGVYLGDVFSTPDGQAEAEHNNLRLTAGDMDEAIVGTVSWLPNGPSLADPGDVRPFDRIAQLSAGFFDGADACG
ncbi:MAG: neutral zinc metallopeptidase [Acidimicrobiales bacterium]|nr:neutral zinc metallopeptidase [Acidimicrobiales bacterium]